MRFNLLLPPGRLTPWLLLALGGWGLVLAPAHAAATAVVEPHTFTNDSGAAFKGQVLSVVGDEATIKREDGQNFRVKLTLLSKDDQAFIRDWLVKNAITHGDGVFSIHAAIVKGVVNIKPNADLHQTTTSWSENYQLTLKSQIAANWGTLHVRYIVFYQTANFGQLPPNDFVQSRKAGSVDVEKLAGNESKVIPLDKVSLASYIKTNNYIWANGAPTTASDKSKGIWVRVYDDADNLLQEWASDPDILKTEQWTSTTARGGARMASPYSTTPGTRGPTAPPAR